VDIRIRKAYKWKGDKVKIKKGYESMSPYFSSIKLLLKNAEAIIHIGTETAARSKSSHHLK
jgi:hypothetical protein